MGVAVVTAHTAASEGHPSPHGLAECASQLQRQYPLCYVNSYTLPQSLLQLPRFPLSESALVEGLIAIPRLNASPGQGAGMRCVHRTPTSDAVLFCCSGQKASDPLPRSTHLNCWPPWNLWPYLAVQRADNGEDFIQ